MLLMISSIFMYISTFMLLPTLPLYVRNIGFLDPTVGGFIVFAYTVGCMVPRMFWGNLADSWARKPVFLIGVLIIGSFSPFFGVFLTIAGVITVRLIQGIGFSASSTTASIIAADLAPASRRAEGISFYTMANTIGMVSGPALGLFMLNRFGSWGLFGVSLLSGLISFSTGMIINYEKKKRLAAMNSDPDKTPIQKPVLTLAILKTAFKRLIVVERSVLSTCLVLLTIVLPYGGIMAFIASFGTDRGVGEIGLYFSIFAVAQFAVRLVVGRLSDRYGVTKILIPSILSIIGAMLVLFWADSLGVFLVSAFLFGIGFGAVMPVLQATAFTFCPDDRRGAAIATFFSTADLAYGAGAIITSLGIRQFGYEIAFAGLAIFGMAGFVFFLTILYPRIKSLKKTRELEKEQKMKLAENPSRG